MASFLGKVAAASAVGGRFWFVCCVGTKGCGLLLWFAKHDLCLTTGENWSGTQTKRVVNRRRRRVREGEMHLSSFRQQISFNIKVLITFTVLLFAYQC